MTAPASPLQPAELLAALNAAAGSPVAGMRATESVPADAPDVGALSAARGQALLAAWSGTQLHASAPGLLATEDRDLALLVGDWCLAHALQALARDGDLAAIGHLADAIAGCALTLDAPDGGALRADVWKSTSQKLAVVS